MKSREALRERCELIGLYAITVTFATFVAVGITDIDGQQASSFRHQYAVIEGPDDRGDGLMLVAERSTGIIYFASIMDHDKLVIQSVVYDADGRPMHVDISK